MKGCSLLAWESWINDPGRGGRRGGLVRPSVAVRPGVVVDDAPPVEEEEGPQQRQGRAGRRPPRAQEHRGGREERAAQQAPTQGPRRHVRAPALGGLRGGARVGHAREHEEGPAAAAAQAHPPVQVRRRQHHLAGRPELQGAPAAAPEGHPRGLEPGAHRVGVPPLGGERAREGGAALHHPQQLELHHVHHPVRLDKVLEEVGGAEERLAQRPAEPAAGRVAPLRAAARHVRDVVVPVDLRPRQVPLPAARRAKGLYQRVDFRPFARGHGTARVGAPNQLQELVHPRFVWVALLDDGVVAVAPVNEAVGEPHAPGVRGVHLLVPKQESLQSGAGGRRRSRCRHGHGCGCWGRGRGRGGGRHRRRGQRGRRRRRRRCRGGGRGPWPRSRGGRGGGRHGGGPRPLRDLRAGLPLQLLEERRGQVALPEAGQHGHHALGRRRPLPAPQLLLLAAGHLQPARHAQRRGHGRPGADPAEQALLPRQPPGRRERLLARHLLDAVDQRRVAVPGDEAGADTLNLVRALRAPTQNRRLHGLHCNDNCFVGLGLEELRASSQCTSSSHTSDEVVNAAISLLPYFWTSGLPVDDWVIGIIKLPQNLRITPKFCLDLFGFGNSPVHALGCWCED
mmetsp:Transcript_3639/g.6194  ORF Transcript_3639/g.6194 Transcript_3639/m.6194 type:complete len:623 (+) Transcript_3639:501-2369(+)